MEANLATAVGCDFLGLMVIVAVGIGNRLQFLKRSIERNCIVAMLAVAFVSCVLDFVVYLFVGSPGWLARTVVYVGKSWLFFGHSLVAVAWVVFLREHLNVWHGRRTLVLLCALPVLMDVLLVVNLFVPIVFSVDDANEYHRGALVSAYFLYLALYVLLGVYMSTTVRLRRNLPFFPIWSFALPMLVGIVAQNLFYGLSVLWPCVAIAICGITISLQNDNVYRDRLTGLYNRYFFDAYQLDHRRRDKAFYIMGIMIDLDGFKRINDSFGHAVGDEALVQTASILRDSVPDSVVVIRYAGDEFILIEESNDMDVIQRYEASIRAGFDAFNQSGKAPYQLSASMGSYVYDPAVMSMEDFINRIDKSLYESKAEHYRTVGNDRRGGGGGDRRSGGEGGGEGA